MSNMDNIAVTKLTAPLGSRLTIDVNEIILTRQTSISRGPPLIYQIEAPVENLMTLIIKYIEIEALPEDKVLAHRLQIAKQ